MGKGKVRPLAEQDAQAEQPYPPMVTLLSAADQTTVNAFEATKGMAKLQVWCEDLFSRFFACCAVRVDVLPSLAVSMSEVLPPEQIQKWGKIKGKAVQYVSEGKPQKVKELLAKTETDFKDCKPHIEVLARRADTIFKAATLKYLESQVEAASLVSNLKHTGLLHP